MNNIWHIEHKFSSLCDLCVPIEGDPEDIPLIEVTHFGNINEKGEINIGIHGGRLGNRASPAAELILRRETFGDDLFNWGGCIFVSERMRQAMALDPSEIRFFEVDDSQSAPLARSKKYQMIEPLVFEDVLDPEKSEYNPESIMPDYGPVEIKNFVVRPDAKPTHDLFFDQFFSTIMLCTDQFALRILKAGCTGMWFTDPNRCGRGQPPKLYRTLRGIEQADYWDKKSNIEITKLVQAIK